MDDDPAPQPVDALQGPFPGPIALIAKYDSYGFATDLEELDLSGFFSILVFPIHNAAAFTPAQRQRFDRVLPLHATTNVTDPALLGALSAVRLPEIEAVLELLLAQVAPDQVHLIGLEEELLRPLAALRARLGLPGPRPDDVARFVDKDAMKACFRQHDILAPAAVILEGVPETELPAVEAMLSKNLHFPLFIKPCDGVASASAARLPGPGELSAWLGAHRGTRQAYVVEEFVVGTEVFAYGLAQQGTLSLLSVDEMHLPMFEAIASGAPIAERSLPRTSPVFSRIAQVVQQVFRAVSPVPDGNFVVQLMRSHREDAIYVVEISARVPGDIAPRTLRWATGLNVEVAHIRLQLPQAPPVPVPEQQRSVATLLLPRRAGTVRALQPLPALHPQTTVSVQWLVAPGQTLPAPQTYDDVACFVQLVSDSPETLAEDYRQMVTFQPLILEETSP